MSYLFLEIVQADEASVDFSFNIFHVNSFWCSSLFCTEQFNSFVENKMMSVEMSHFVYKQFGQYSLFAHHILLGHHNLTYTRWLKKMSNSAKCNFS